MSISQYLSRHAEPDCTLGDTLAGPYDHVLCIPAYGEDPGFLDRLLSLADYKKLLVILVVNAPPDAQNHLLDLNRELISQLVARYQTLQEFSSPAWLLAWRENTDLLLVNRSIPGYFLDVKGGVGLARKIACDIACKLVRRQVITSPWIHSTDADAVLPASYFSACRQLDHASTSAATYPFRHQPGPHQDMVQAQSLYDTSLHYYVRGLVWAESPWAFHTIGSTLVVNATAYAQARGFPKRQAGEDFYLLNKLAKLGHIQALTTGPVELASRTSDRVPFGTGPALTRIMALADPEQDYLFYHPACFFALKIWQHLLQELWSLNGQLPDEQKIHAVIQTLEADKPPGITLPVEVIIQALHGQGLERALHHAAGHSTTEAVFKRHIQHWFDAFRTLKFIHWLRDNHYPSLPLAEARQLAPTLLSYT